MLPCVWSLTHWWRLTARLQDYNLLHFPQMVNRKVRQRRRDWWACLDSSLDKNMALHVHRTTFVWVLRRSPSCCQLVLVLGRTDDTGLSRTCVPTNPGQRRQRTGSRFTKRSCWWLVQWVYGDMQMGASTRYRCTVCSLVGGVAVVVPKNRSFDFKTSATK